MPNLHVSNCYQQAKTIHRLLLILADDLGDCSAVKGANPELARFGDTTCDLEKVLQNMRDRLQVLAE